MRIARSAFCIAAAFAALAVVCPDRLHGQHPQTAQPPTFKSATAIVEVDAVILDKDGRFVPGLKADDVTLLEDGRPQKIEHFYMVTHDLGTGPNAPVSEYADQADFRAHRLFVLLFDEGSLANESLMRAKQGAEAFVRDQMGPEDAGGVFVNGGMFRGLLTTDKLELLAGIRAVKPAFDTRQSILAPFREWPRIGSELDATRISDGAREVTASLASDACNEKPADCREAGGLEQVENLIQKKANLYVRQAQNLMNQTVQNVQAVARGLGRLPGRKTVVFITEGFYVEDSRSVLQTIAGEAARSGVTIYSIDARGLINGRSPNPDVVRPDRARSTAFDPGEDGPDILTSGTGGFMVRGIDDMSRAFGLIVRDTSTYYVIGYQPENATMDGKFRKIEVRTRVPKVKVRARKGYVAVNLPPQQSIWGPGK